MTKAGSPCSRRGPGTPFTASRTYRPRWRPTVWLWPGRRPRPTFPSACRPTPYATWQASPVYGCSAGGMPAAAPRCTLPGIGCRKWRAASMRACRRCRPWSSTTSQGTPLGQSPPRLVRCLRWVPPTEPVRSPVPSPDGRGSPPPAPGSAACTPLALASRIRARRHVEMIGQAVAGVATEGEPDGPVSRDETGCGAGVGVEQAGEAFAEDGLRAVGSRTVEAADDQTQGDGPALARQVSDRAAGAAVQATRRPAAAGAIRRRSGRGEQSDSHSEGKHEVVDAQAGASQERRKHWARLSNLAAVKNRPISQYHHSTGQLP